MWRGHVLGWNMEYVCGGVFVCGWWGVCVWGWYMEGGCMEMLCARGGVCLGGYLGGGHPPNTHAPPHPPSTWRRTHITPIFASCGGGLCLGQCGGAVTQQHAWSHNNSHPETSTNYQHPSNDLQELTASIRRPVEINSIHPTPSEIGSIHLQTPRNQEIYQMTSKNWQHLSETSGN